MGVGESVRRTAHTNGKGVRAGVKPSSDSQSGGSRISSPTRATERLPFTRSRSPAIHALGGAFGLPHRTQSPSVVQRARHAVPMPTRFLLPGTVNITFRIPFTVTCWMVSIDLRQAAENILLLASLGFGAEKLRAVSGGPLSPDMWCSIGERLGPAFSYPRKLDSLPRNLTTHHCIHNLLLYYTPCMAQGNRSYGYRF